MGLLEGLLYAWHQGGTAHLIREFKEALRHPQRAQCGALRRILSAAAGTEYGRRHGFDRISGPDQYRRNLPLVNYEDIAELSDRQRSGEPDVLVPGRPRMFARTSGTTGRSKYIPVTRRSYLDFHFAQSVWRNRLLRDHRCGILGRRLLTIISPADEEHTSAGIPCGAITGKIYLSQSPATRRFFPVPYEVMAMDDYRAKYYLIARLAACADIGTVATANASTLIVLAEQIARNAEMLARDIERGGVSIDSGLNSQLAEKLWPGLAPNPEVAARIRRVLDEGRELTPKDLWPDIEVAAVWLGGSAGFFVPRVRELYSPRAVRDPGFNASEGFFAVPLEDETAVGAPVLSRVFMEFIPEESNDCREPETLLAHQLEEGQRYYLVITTSGGLYRYRIGDLVEVAGRSAAGAPMLRFMSKGARILSLTGEKVSEGQVTEAMSRSVAETGIAIKGFTVSVRVPGNEKPGYVLAVESLDDIDGQRLRPLLAAFERELNALNMEYRSKRDSLRLSAPVMLVLEPGSYEAWRSERLAGGAHDGQIKPPNLLPMEEFERNFQASDFVTMQETTVK